MPPRCVGAGGLSRVELLEELPIFLCERAVDLLPITRWQGVKDICGFCDFLQTIG